MIFSGVSKTGTRNVGAMVIDEFFPPDYDRFIRAVCPYQEPRQHVYARWRDPAKRPRALALEIPFVHCSTNVQEYVVHLFGFPEALSKIFFLRDLLFPMELQGLGFIVILDLGALSQYEESRLLARMSDPTKSALAWTLAHNLPFVVVAKAPDTSSAHTSRLAKYCMFNHLFGNFAGRGTTPAGRQYSTEELQSIFGLNANVPICHCTSSFGDEQVQQVLRNLIEQLETS
jgi:hypothetical protein